MGVYNCEDTIEESINSILSQTYNDWELIICDDCSQDSTYHIVEKIKDQNPQKIVLIRNKENMKLAASLNHCLQYAKGNYIARMDGDDISLPERFEKQVNYLELHPEIDLVGTLMIPFDENGERVVRKKTEKPDKYILRRETPFNHATIMARRKVFDILRGYTVSSRTNRGQDVDLWFRFYKAGFTGINIQEGLYKVRESNNDFKRRSLKAGWNVSKTLLWGFRLLDYPYKYYPYILKPIIASILPNKIMIKYHKLKDVKKQ